MTKNDLQARILKKALQSARTARQAEYDRETAADAQVKPPISEMLRNRFGFAGNTNADANQKKQERK